MHLPLLAARRERRAPLHRAALLLVVPILAACATPDAESDQESDQESELFDVGAGSQVEPEVETASPRATPRRDPKRSRTGRPRPATPSPTADNELGLPRDVIERLGGMADLYGYGLGPGTSLSYQQATDFAYAVSLVCDDLRSGASTVADAIDEDVSMGAPTADARGFNTYLADDFCPAYYAAGN